MFTSHLRSTDFQSGFIVFAGKDVGLSGLKALRALHGIRIHLACMLNLAGGVLVSHTLLVLDVALLLGD